MLQRVEIQIRLDMNCSQAVFKNAVVYGKPIFLNCINCYHSGCCSNKIRKLDWPIHYREKSIFSRTIHLWKVFPEAVHCFFGGHILVWNKKWAWNEVPNGSQRTKSFYFHFKTPSIIITYSLVKKKMYERCVNVCRVFNTKI